MEELNRALGTLKKRSGKVDQILKITMRRYLTNGISYPFVFIDRDYQRIYDLEV